MNRSIIYFDNAATTKPDQSVIESYLKVNNEFYANSGSVHSFGYEARRLLDSAREQILKVLKLNSYDVIFVSGATESDNLAIKGIAHQYSNRGKHLITSIVEHSAVMNCFRSLEDEGFQVTYLPVDQYGRIHIEDLKKAIDDETILVSIMAANNETGGINNIDEIAKIVHQYPKAFFHSDCVQAFGKTDITYNNMDLITFCGHKIHGLKGSGCLLKKKNILLNPIVSGGGQEEGNRSGTVDVAGACALSKSVRLIFDQKNTNYEIVKPIHDLIYDYLNKNKQLFEINSSFDNPYIINFSTLTVKASVLVEALSKKGIMVSTKSACNSKGELLSDVIFACKSNNDLAHNTIRISFSHLNTIEEAKIFINEVDSIIRGLRK